jgi:hypothetical protein
MVTLIGPKGTSPPFYKKKDSIPKFQPLQITTKEEARMQVSHIRYMYKKK